MGLFRKKTDEPDQLSVLRSEIVSLRERLDAADQQKAELRAMVENVDQTNAVLYSRVDSLDSARADVQSLTDRLNTSPLLPPPSAPDGRIDDLLRQVATLSDTVTAQGLTPVVDPAEVNALATLLDAISADLIAQAARVDAAVTSANSRPDEATVDPDDVAAMRSEMAQMAERMATLDRRMTNVSMELANQLTELSNDLEVLLDAANDDGADNGDETAAVSLAIEAVQQSTERLASEQARYQIQFREDLAELAERLRRPAR